MEDSLLRVPVLCHECGKEILTELPSLATAEALLRGSPIQLYATCHGRAWQASCVELEQLREYLDAANLSRPALELNVTAG
jgi:hypothetical protein